VVQLKIHVVYLGVREIGPKRMTSSMDTFSTRLQGTDRLPENNAVIAVVVDQERPLALVVR
jgi:hypothetical protein